jgi:oxygen-independent coproporphyrinogen-3 oxidase
VATAINQDRWLRAYRAEIARTGALTGRRLLGSIFFGGGTPSLMDGEVVAGVIEEAARHWHFANDIEITLEANPGSVEAARFQAYREAGVNRVSMGLQALNDRDLRALGRMHTVAEARAAFEVARATFPRVSFDLIYARQGQTLRDWETELGEALGMAADHLSLYQLTIEPDTVFAARHARGRLKGLPDEDLGADLFELTQDLCGAAGLPAYEVSNHAKSGAESRHNLVYWRSGDWAGIGPGAHGRLTLGRVRLATECPRTPGEWLSSVETRGSGQSFVVPLTAEERAEEYLLMSLRLAEGTETARYEALGGKALPEAEVQGLVADGLMTTGSGRAAATARGRAVLNALIGRLA